MSLIHLKIKHFDTWDVICTCWSIASREGADSCSSSLGRTKWEGWLGFCTWIKNWLKSSHNQPSAHLLLLKYVINAFENKSFRYMGCYLHLLVPCNARRSRWLFIISWENLVGRLIGILHLNKNLVKIESYFLIFVQKFTSNSSTKFKSWKLNHYLLLQ